MSEHGAAERSRHRHLELRARASLPTHGNTLFVTGAGHELRGVLSLSRLVLGDPEARVADEMTPQPVFFYTDDDMSDAVIAGRRGPLRAHRARRAHADRRERRRERGQPVGRAHAAGALPARALARGAAALTRRLGWRLRASLSKHEL